MREYISKYLKYITLSIIIVGAIVLFNMQFNTNKLFTNVETTLSKLIYKDGEGPLGTVSLSSAKYYNDNVLLASNKNYKNKLDRISFDITTTSIEDESELEYVIIYDNSNDDSTYIPTDDSGDPVYGEDEINITNSFATTIDVNNGKLVVRYIDGTDYIPGNYKIYVWPTNNPTGIKDQPFTLLDDFYGFDIEEEATLTTTGINTSINNWTLELTNIDNIDLSKINLDVVYKEEDNVKLDFTEYFSILNTALASEDETKGTMTIKSVPTKNGLTLESGTYTLKFSYLDDTGSTVLGTLEKEATLTVLEKEYDFTETESSSYRVTSSSIYYELTKYDEINDEVTIVVNDETKVLTSNEFITSYTGIDLNDVVTDDEGNILYKYSDDISIKSVTVEDSVEYVNYYDSNNELQSITMEDFNSSYGYLDTNTYKFEDNKVIRKVNGRYRSIDNNKKTIRYADGGRFEFTYSYDDLTASDFEKVSVLLRHIADENYSNEDFKVIDNGIKKTRELSDDEEYKKVLGYSFEDYNGTVDTEASNSFELTYDVDTVNKKINIVIIYDNRLSRYAGPYEIVLTMGNDAKLVKRFTIEDSLVDFYLATYVDKHNGGGNPLTDKYPPANKDYEYYLSLRMVKGDIDPNYQFSSSELDTKIYTKRADLDEHGDIYFYDQVDYVIKLVNYKDDVITYKYSTDVNLPDDERKYTDVTEELDGSSLFETRYKEIYDLLNNYEFDLDGNIDTTTDNYEKRIVSKITTNGVDYVTYYNGSENVTVETNKYVTVVGNINTLINAYKYFDYAANGSVIVGNLKGSYKSNTYEYDDSYDVTSLFNITVSEDTTDIDHAIKVLPKTEVPAGTYYTYVNYNSALYGVGYVNNTIANDGIYEDMNEVVIRPEKYPGLWNRNIHMSSITYTDPEYSLYVSDGLLSNESDDTPNVYYNSVSHIKYRVTPKYIYDYSDITYTLQKQTGESTWDDVDTDKYSISYLDDLDNEISDISSYSGSYYIVLNTTDDIGSGMYRLNIEYTNPTNNISLSEDVSIDIDLTKKYYGILINSNSDRLEFPHNYSVTKKTILEGVNTTSFDNVTVDIYYFDNGNKVKLTQEGNEYSYNDGENTTVFFTTSSEVVDGKLEYSFTNVANVSLMGNYVVEYNYQEDSNPVSTKSQTMHVAQDQYKMIFENEYPRATATELSFAVDFTTYYIDRASLSDIKFDFYKYNESLNDYEDVSSQSINTNDRHITGYQLEGISCESEVCTGKARFFLNKNKVSYQDFYKFTATYSNVQEEVSVSEFGNMFAWDIASSTITSAYEHDDTTETITGLYNDLTNQQIKVVLNNNIHENNISWNVNTTCLASSGEACDPTSGTYTSLFNSTNTTGTDKTLILTPKVDNQGNVRIAPGKYALVLYYDRNEYRVVEFEVHAQYVTTEYIVSSEYGEATIKSILPTPDGDEELEGMYKNLQGELSIETNIVGVEYSIVNRYVVNSLNRKVNQFEINRLDEFVNTHITKVTYNPNNGVLDQGSYTLVTEFISPTGETIKTNYTFTIDKDYYDFNIVDYSSTPEYLIVNTTGSAIFTIQTKSLYYLDKDQHNNIANGRMYTFKNNSKIYDINGNDVTSSFELSVTAHSDIAVSNKFDIKATFRGNTINPGSYRFKTLFNLNNRVVEKEYWFTIDEANRYITLSDLSSTSSAPDGLIHKNYGTSLSMDYTSNTEGAKDNIDVKVMIGESNVTDKFDIEVTNNKINLSYDETSELTAGNYIIIVTYEGTINNVSFTVLDDYTVDETVLDSETFNVSNQQIVARNISKTGISKTDFVNLLTNVKEGYIITDSQGNNITNTVQTIGTGMKFINPGEEPYVIVIAGDISGDGLLTPSDYVFARKHLLGTGLLTNPYLLAGDYNGDGLLTPSDYVLIRKALMS